MRHFKFMKFQRVDRYFVLYNTS